MSTDTKIGFAALVIFALAVALAAWDVYTSPQIGF